MKHRKLIFGFLTSMCLSSTIFLNVLAADKNDMSIYSGVDKTVVVVPTSGIRSVSELANTDYKPSIDDLQNAYRHYDRSDGLTEYFFTGDTTRHTNDMPTYLSWLIEQNIISRDYNITINYINSKFPEVKLDQTDTTVMLSSKVNKTEFLTTLYKAIYGSIASRGVALVTENYRVQDGKMVQFSQSSSTYTPSGNIINDNYASNSKLDVTEYYKIFTGEGGKGGDGGGYNGDGGDGGDGGNVTVNSLTNYEDIEFEPHGDVLIYQSSDVPEIYISAMLNRGLISSDDGILPSFMEMHNRATTSNGVTSYMAWDPRLNPILYNNIDNKQVLCTPVSTINHSYQGQAVGPLGLNYTVNWTGNTLSIIKKSAYPSYFENDSTMSKMEAYRYIYNFMKNSEKAMSELEASIVAYKYGARFEKMVKSEDVPVMEYLTAKGILNFDSNEDFLNCYSPVDWATVYQILYRVANKEARFNFSEVQLTDSDSYWQAKGFAERSVYISKQDVSVMPTLVRAEGTDGITVSMTNSSEMYTDFVVTLLDDTVPYYQDKTATNDSLFSTTWQKVNIDSVVYDFDIDDLAVVVKESLDIHNGKATKYSSKALLAIAKARTIRDSYNPITGILNNGNTDITVQKEIAENILGNAFVLTDLKSQIVSSLSSNKDYTSESQSVDRALTELTKSFIAWYGADGTSVAPSPTSTFSITATFSDASGNNSNWTVSDGSKMTNVISDGLVASSGAASRGQFIYDRLSTLKIIPSSTNSPIYSMERANLYSPDSAKFMHSTISIAYGVSSSAISSAIITSNSDNDVIASASIGTTADITKVNVVTDDNQSYVSFRQIKEVYPNIVKMSDYILKNTDTGSYAYINPTKQTALVGTAVINVEGAPVINRNDELYYDWQIIYKLFPSAISRSLNIGENVFFSDILAENENYAMDIKSADQISSSKTTALEVVTNYGNDLDTPAENLSLDIDGNNHGLFLSMSTLDTNANMIYRTIKSGTKELAIVILTLVPDTSSDLDVQISKNPTMQEMLDFVSTAPTTEKGAKRWQRNINLSNIFANWMYQTTDEKYVQTGLVKPVLTVLEMPDLNDENKEELMQQLGTLDNIGTTPTLEVLQSNVLSKTVIDDEEDRTIFQIDTMSNFDGAIWDPVSPPATITDNNRITYAVSSSRLYMYAYGRLYCSYQAIPNLKYVNTETDKYFYIDTAKIVPTWKVGASFKMAIGSSDYRAQVVKLNTDGTATVVILDPLTGQPGYNNPVGNFKLYNRSLSNDEKQGYSNDIITLFRNSLRQTYPDIDFAEDRIYSEPQTIYSTDLKYNFVDNKGEIYTVNAKTTEKKHSDTVNGKKITKTNCFVFPQIKIPITTYSIADGTLLSTPPTVSSFMPSIVFNSLNRCIVDQMIDSSLGAVKVNELEDGAVLTMNGATLVARTDAQGKLFTGIVTIDKSLSRANETYPSSQNIFSTFVSTMIGYGNQYINLSHFFRQCDYAIVYNNTTPQEEPYVKTLQVVYPNQQTLELFYKKEDNSISKFNITPNVGITNNLNIWSTLTSIRFYDGLLAYKTNEVNGVAVYSLLSRAENISVGNLSNIPFFEDSVLDVHLSDITTEIVSAKFQNLPLASVFKEDFVSKFKEAFNGNIVDLLQLIFVVVIIWLILASWVCYAFKISRLNGILEMIRYPNGETNARGPDLIKIISLGTLSLETEYKLGTFIVYNIILSYLLAILYIV